MLAKTLIKLEDFQDPRWPKYSVNADYEASFHGTASDWTVEISIDSDEVHVWNEIKEWYNKSTLEIKNLPPGLQISIQGKALEKASEKFSRGEIELFTSEDRYRDSNE